MARTRMKAVDGYQIQPMLPMQTGLFGAVCEDAEFKTYDGRVCVEALVRLGLIPGPYTLVLTIEQALEADIIERVVDDERGCRCEVCDGRNDDPAGIHGTRGA